MDSWRTDSKTKKQEESNSLISYENQQRASNLLDAIQSNMKRVGSVLNTIVSCEKQLGTNMAYPMSITNCFTYGYYEPDESEKWSTLNYNFEASAVVNDSLVVRGWSSSNAVDELLDSSIQLMSPGVSISNWIKWLEEELKSKSLYPVENTFGYKLNSNIQLNKECNENFEEGSTYVVKISVRNGQEAPIPINKSTGWYTIKQEKKELKLASSKQIYKKIKSLKYSNICNRHLKDVYGFKLGVKDLTNKGILEQSKPVLFPNSSCTSVCKTVCLRPTCRVLL